MSTVVDLALCLLLVSASVGLLVESTPEARTAPPAAEPVVSTLGAATTTVEYVHDDRTRRATATLAELLAAVAQCRANSSVGAGNYTDGVVERLTALVRNRSGAIHIAARWRPTPEDSVDGEVEIGSRPPSGATVDAATLALPHRPPGCRELRSSHRRTAQNSTGIVRVVVRTWWP